MNDKKAPTGERLAKVIARAGLCSRRDAESWITAGRVSVNGSSVKTPAFNVIESDTVLVDDKPIARREPTQAWLYHKPAGLMVTEKDPEGRPTVFEAFEELGLPRVLTVGRLDYNTEGLMLLTNDGGLKRALELPATGWVRRYRVRAFGSVTQQQLDKLAGGTTVDDVEYGPIEATLDSVKGSNVWLTMALREGKNREVRNVLGGLGLEVNRLIRLSYGPFQLGDLPVGAVEKVKERVLRDQLGKRLAEKAGADFDSPAREEEAGQPRRVKPESRPTERDRFGGLKRRPERRQPEAPAGRERTVHFDDGRPSQTFVQQPPRDKRRGEDDRSGGAGDRPARREGSKPFSKAPGDRKPFRKDEGRPASRRPSGPDRDRDAGDRPARREGSKPFSKAPGDRKPFRRDDDRPASKRPSGPVRDRDAGDRPVRREGSKPFSKAPGDRKPFRRDDDRPASKRPSGPVRDRDAGDRPARREGSKPFSKAPGDKKPFRKDDSRPASRRPSGPVRDRDAGDRPPRREGAKPFGKSAGDKKPFSKGPRPERSGVKRPEGPRTGAKPGAHRPPPRKPRGE